MKDEERDFHSLNSTWVFLKDFGNKSNLARNLFLYGSKENQRKSQSQDSPEKSPPLRRSSEQHTSLPNQLSVNTDSNSMRKEKEDSTEL